VNGVPVTGLDDNRSMLFDDNAISISRGICKNWLKYPVMNGPSCSSH